MSETVTLRYDDAVLRGSMARSPEIMRAELVPAVTEASLFAEREIRDRTPTSGAGTLRDSIGALPVTIGAQSISAGVGTSLAYAAPVELGAKPHWAPLAPLRDWVERVLGKRDEEADQVARAIRFKIATEGTEGAFMFRDGMAAVDPYVRELLAAAAARGAARIGGGG